jgi:hypothetical protein
VLPPCSGARLIESASEVSMNTIAHHVVARERKLVAPRGPNAVWLPAPPKAPAKSAAEPLCSMITMISTKHTRIGRTRQPIQIRPMATSIEIVHFIHEGISSSLARRDNPAHSARRMISGFR